ncbi:hypothetical protein B0A49_07064 [Cryomyces minteri]|uniref:GATA-type domain-containing protein n=1 Tax=Cryomyces minteri TaxID=331657 RepID=A0A4U0X065_9PEZI|nr:hypothetical protein B0A49_07064 [Cryomyces minteri]
MINPPQAFVSSYAPRIRTYANSLLTPVIPPTTQIAASRTTKRGTTAINYSEEFEDEDLDDSEGPRRRPTGLRSLRIEEQNVDKSEKPTPLGKELSAPVEVQPIWREWMGKPKRGIVDRTEKQLQVQCALPLTLIPIRIDLDMPSFRPMAPLPTPNNARDLGIDETLPAYKLPDPTPAFRLKDTFLWNLHEALMTPDQFAKVFVEELDFPLERKIPLCMQIAEQIRKQLEEYAGVALHPLFHSTNSVSADGAPTKSVLPALSRDQSSTPRPGTPSNGLLAPLNGITDIFMPPTPAANPSASITATAHLLLHSDDILNPDDTYRCVINLSINLLNQLYTDKFEWSLLHPVGLAEVFAKQTCADLGLFGEWPPAMTHAIYEAVLRLKKEACENGGLVGYGDIDNDAAEGAEAGWRYDHEHLGDEWEPKVETLSKEEIDRREGDRERQIRRLRRETARFSSTANMAGGIPQQQANDYFNGVLDGQDQQLGRGERSKKKRRFRSLSPAGRDTPDATQGFGGASGGLQDHERQFWRCSHCCVWGSAVWAVRDGPHGPRSLCNNCGFLYERERKLPPWSKDLFAGDRAFGTR